jgi:hypothetical protein
VAQTFLEDLPDRRAEDAFIPQKKRGKDQYGEGVDEAGGGEQDPGATPELVLNT